jgi:hypothetical protein
MGRRGGLLVSTRAAAQADHMALRRRRESGGRPDVGSGIDPGHKKTSRVVPGGLLTEGATRRYVRKPPRRIIIEAVPTTAVTYIAAMLADMRQRR